MVAETIPIVYPPVPYTVFFPVLLVVVQVGRCCGGNVYNVRQGPHGMWPMPGAQEDIGCTVLRLLAGGHCPMTAFGWLLLVDTL